MTAQPASIIADSAVADDFSALGRLLARSAILAESHQADAANDLMGRAIASTEGLSDLTVAALHQFLSELIADWIEAGMDDLALAEILQRGADDPAAMRSAIRELFNVIACLSLPHHS